ncbi:amine sulfotransferase-like isoform X3 [Acropora millepora]|uniref:amine sulfotransferase-like isoform X3 n=1 Tax=Acropora millepora TaxID=45264 RepID=UPI001CF27149|nr:amine sulfotransferase-like isoform X3 [Acropora millepora]
MGDFHIIQEIEGDFKGPRQALVCGVRVPFYLPIVDKDFEKDLSRFETREDDVFIVTYPKSGTTWVQEIVWQIYHNGAVSRENITERYARFEKSRLFPRPGDEPAVTLSSRPSPRFIKCHLPYHLLPMSQNEANRSKYIYVARNPKDVAVSYFLFERSFGPDTDFVGTFENFANFLVDGKGSYGLWSDHVLAWWKRRNDPHILFLKYEDLKKDLYTNVRTLSEFLNKPLSKDVIAKIAHQCTFGEMKKNSDNFSIKNVNSKPLFLRKGQIGDWRNYFSAELSKKFDEILVSKLEGSGLSFDFGTSDN